MGRPVYLAKECKPFTLPYQKSAAVSGDIGVHYVPGPDFERLELIFHDTAKF
jgi:hypothetical protein